MTEKKTKRPLDHLAEFVDDEEIIRGIMEGRLRADRNYDQEEVVEAKRRIDKIVRPPTSNQKNIKAHEHSGVYIVTLYNPFSRVRYLTLATNGELHFTADDDGKINWRAIDEGELIGHDSLESVIRSTIGNEPLPKLEHIRERKKVIRKKGGKKQEPRAPRKTDLFVVDPLLKQYLRQHSRWLAHDMHARKSPTEKEVLATREDLEAILPPSLLERTHESGNGITAQEVSCFVREHRKTVTSTRKIRLESLREHNLVREKIQQYLAQVGEGRKRLEYLTKASNGRTTALYFTDSKNSIKDIDAAEVVETLRDIAIHQLYRQKPEDAANISEATMDWVSVTLALDHVLSDDYIQQHVLPEFERRTAEEGENEMRNERIFQGMVNLLKLLTDPQEMYSPSELGFIVKGLWAHPKGYFMKQKKRGEDDGEEELRELRGAETQYVSPGSHLMRRMDIYKPILMRSLDNLLQEGSIPSKLALTTKRDCLSLGKLLYDKVPQDTRDKIFTRLDDPDEPLLSLRSEKWVGATMLSILEYFVALHKEEIYDKISLQTQNKK